MVDSELSYNSGFELQPINNKYKKFFKNKYK